MSNFAHIAADDSNPAASVGVQSWSRGDIFPAVISVVEEYDAPIGWSQWRELNSQLAHHECIVRFYDNYLANFYERSLSERIISRQYVLSLAGWNDAALASYDAARAEAIERINHVDMLDQDADAAYRYSMRSHFAYSPEAVAQGEMAGGYPVPNRIGLIRR